MDPLKNTLNLIASPQTWTEVVRAVLSAEHGTDYNPIDDSVSDSGNDGYITSRKQLFARHCFVKPAGKTKAKIIAKINSDFNKAIELIKSGELEINEWTFVCNYDLPHEVLIHLKKLGNDAGIVTNFMTSDNIANLLNKHPEVRKRFSFIHQEDFSSDLKEVKKSLDNLITKSSDTTHIEEIEVKDDSPTSTMMNVRPRNLSEEQRDEINADADYNYAISFVDKKPEVEEKSKLKAIVYTSSNPMVRVQALAVVDNWFDPLNESLDELLSLSEIGVNSAKETNNASAQAETLGTRLKYVSLKLSRLHIDVVGIDMYANTGLFQTDSNLRNQLVEQIRALDTERTKLMKDVLEAAATANDALTIGDSHLRIADAAGHVGALLKRTGNYKDADAQIKLAKLAYNEAQRFYNAAGLNDRSLYAMSNLANMLRDIGEANTAIAIANKVIDEAEKLGLERLRGNALKIKLHAETGKVPDYVNGKTEI